MARLRTTKRRARRSIHSRKRNLFGGFFGGRSDFAKLTKELRADPDSKSLQREVIVAGAEANKTTDQIKKAFRSAKVPTFDTRQALARFVEEKRQRAKQVAKKEKKKAKKVARKETARKLKKLSGAKRKTFSIFKSAEKGGNGNGKKKAAKGFSPSQQSFLERLGPKARAQAEQQIRANPGRRGTSWLLGNPRKNTKRRNLTIIKRAKVVRANAKRKKAVSRKQKAVGRKNPRGKVHLTKRFKRERLQSPKKFKRFFTKVVKGGKRVIVGVKRSGKTAAQAILTPRKGKGNPKGQEHYYEVSWTGPSGRRNAEYIRALSKKDAERIARKSMEPPQLRALSVRSVSPAEWHRERHGNPKRRKKRNASPQARADAKRKQFTGRRVNKHQTMTAPNGTPRRVAALGKLSYLKLKGYPGMSFSEKEAPTVAMNPQGSQLFLIGGRGKFNPSTGSGRLESIGYLARKSHLKDKNRMDYRHRFNSAPRFWVDKEGFGRISRGRYKVTAAGIEG